MEVCPICHSPINVTDAQREELRSRGVYAWTDDPFLTEQGLSGDQFKGLVFFNWRHIKEIQGARIAQEISAGVSNRTDFSEISAIIELKKAHINELRTSTEKILTKLAESNPEISLSRYFNYDRDGTYHGTWEYGQKIDNKTEWTDVDRTTGFPSLPSNVTDIRAIHIEELRCQIPVIEEQEEPPFYGIEIIPGSFEFNLRCPNTPPEIEFHVYGEGFEHTGEANPQIYQFDQHIARIKIEAWDRFYVEPLSVGNTTLTADFEGASADALIIVGRYVIYEGDFTKITETRIRYVGDPPEPEEYQVTFWRGTGTGCDGTTLTVTWESGRISGQFDGDDFDIPTSGFPNFYIPSDIGIAYAINGYIVSGNGTIRQDSEEPDEGGDFYMRFSYDPSI